MSDRVLRAGAIFLAFVFGMVVADRTVPDRSDMSELVRACERIRDPNLRVVCIGDVAKSGRK